MLRTLLLAQLVVVAMIGNLTAADVKDLFEARKFKGESGELSYRLLKPKDYDPKKKYPLVLFFHGAGERGKDNAAQLVHGMKDFSSDEIRAKYPAFIIAPQCPDNQQWVNVPWSDAKHTMPKKPSDSMQLALDIVASLQKEFSIDDKRLYVTGLSMGGFGTWDAIQRHPEMFAAAAPICGGGDAEAAKPIAKLPIWVFHGDEDTAVKTQRSRDMVAALKAAGGEPKYTEYKKTGHDSWSATYRDPKFYEWLFEQHK